MEISKPRDLPNIDPRPAFSDRHLADFGITKAKLLANPSRMKWRPRDVRKCVAERNFLAMSAAPAKMRRAFAIIPALAAVGERQV